MRRAWVALTAAMLLAAATSLRLTAAEGARLLYPPDHSAVAGPVRLILATAKDAPAPAATLDGQPLKLTRLAFAETWTLPGRIKTTAKQLGDRQQAAVWVAALDLKAGAHEVVAAGGKLALWRTSDAPTPEGYTLLHSHSAVGDDAPKLDCGGCHDAADSALGAVPTPKACGGCHDEDSVQLIHSHVSPPLARCASCHDPHGTARPKMLVDSKEALCSRCHEAGHSKQ